MQTRTFALIQCLLFFLLLGAMGAYPFFETQASRKDRATVERRKLAPLPSLNINRRSDWKNWAAQFDNFLADNFAFRGPLILTANWLNSVALQDMTNRRYIGGIDGWFFRAESDHENAEGTELEDTLGLKPFNERQLQNWAQLLSSRKLASENLGSKYYFTIAPRKTSIYPEFLPPAFRQSHAATRFEQLLKYLRSGGGETLIDIRSALLSNKANPFFPDLYFKTDAHWNYVGAYFGYKALIEEISKRTQLRLHPLPLEDFALKTKERWNHRGFESETGLAIFEPFPVLFPIKSNVLTRVTGIKNENSDEELEGQLTAARGAQISFAEGGVGNLAMPSVDVKLFSGSASKRCRRLTQDSPYPGIAESIVLLGDSFLEKSAPFFAAHARYTYFCRQILVFDPPTFDEELQMSIRPTFILQGMTESYLLRQPNVARTKSKLG